MKDMSSYALVTAAKNEAGFIGQTLQSVIRQTVQPRKWVIVDDGSTDATPDIVTELARQYQFIELIRSDQAHGRRTFASQVFAAAQGFERVKALNTAFVGFLDADILLDDDYYACLLGKFAADRRLGLVGGRVLDQHVGKLVDIRAGSEEFHVPGGVQFFRRECYDQTGGYVPLELGGQDVLVEMRALSLGWQVRTFGEVKAIHLKPEGAGGEGSWRRSIKQGRRLYLLGYHPLYAFIHCLRRYKQAPAFMSILLKLSGYMAAASRGRPSQVAPETVQQLRAIQKYRMRSLLLGNNTGGRPL